MRRSLALLGLGLLLTALAPDAPGMAQDLGAQDAKPAEPSEAPSPSERLLSAVREQTLRLEQSEQEILAREQAVVALEAEALRILEEARRIRVAVEERIATWESQLGDRVARLSKVYAEMPAKRAAPLLEGLELDLATEVVARMKPKDSAAVLAKMSEPHALKISRRVARPLITGSGPDTKEEAK